MYECVLYGALVIGPVAGTLKSRVHEYIRFKEQHVSTEIHDILETHIYEQRVTPRSRVLHVENDCAKDNSNTRTLRTCLLYTSPSPRDKRQSRMPSSA